MTTLFYFQEKFPQYKWNPNHPLGNVHLTGGGFVKNLEYLKDDFNHEVRNK
jgi:phosphoribosylaminoimidazole (AIR) synthetase